MEEKPSVLLLELDSHLRIWSIFIVLATSLFVFSAWATYKILLARRFSPLRDLPTPTQRPLWRRLLKEPTPWHFEKWMREIPNDGLIRYFGLLNQERVLITSPDGFRDILIANPYHFHKQRAQRVHLEPVLGKGLVFVEGDTHKFHRKQMSPAFAKRCIRDLQPIFWKKTIEVLDIFRQRILDQQQHTKHSLLDGEISGLVEVHEPISLAALDIIGLAAFSLDFTRHRGDKTPMDMVHDYRQLFEHSPSNRLRRLLAHVLPAWMVDLVPIERNKEIAFAKHLLKRFCLRVIGEKRGERFQKSSPDLLEKIMQNGAFSDEVLVEQVKTLLAAGHDTTASSLSSAVAVLSQPQYRHIQDKLRAEIRPLLSNVDLPPVTEIENSQYLSAVRNEVFRLFPSVSWFFRKSVVDTVACGHQIPKGTNLTLCPFAMHRMTDLWGPDAEEFNPDRWLKDTSGRGGARDRNCFMTFGAGPRVCVAQEFAKNQVSTIMAGIFGSYRVEQAEGIDDSPLSHQLTLTRMKGVTVRMTLVEE